MASKNFQEKPFKSQKVSLLQILLLKFDLNSKYLAKLHENSVDNSSLFGRFLRQLINMKMQKLILS